MTEELFLPDWAGLLRRRKLPTCNAQIESALAACFGASGGRRAKAKATSARQVAGVVARSRCVAAANDVRR